MCDAKKTDAEKTDAIWECEEVARELGLVLGLGMREFVIEDEVEGGIRETFESIEEVRGFLYGVKTVRKFEDHPTTELQGYANQFCSAQQMIEYATSRMDTYLAVALPNLSLEDLEDLIDLLPKKYPGMAKVYARLEEIKATKA